MMLRSTGIALWLAVVPVVAGQVLRPGGVAEFQVGMPESWREFAGSGRATPVKIVQVAVAVPPDFDPAIKWPVMVISATSDPGYNSSGRLLRQYAGAGMAAGWILLAADPVEKISPGDDTVRLRLALVNTGLAGLEQLWPAAARAPLAFGGYSGGAKHSGWLTAGFAAQGRRAVGVFQGGINQETVALAARQLHVLGEDYRRIPVYLSGGQRDDIAPPAAHRAVEAALKRSGFRQVRLDLGEGRHEVDPQPLQRALEWFRVLAIPSAGGGSRPPYPSARRTVWPAAPRAWMAASSRAAFTST